MRVGRFRVPDYRLPDLIQDTKKIYEKYGSEAVTDMDTLAMLLGHKSSKSGAFLTKLASLRAFGLVEGRGEIRVTDLGKKVTFPESEKAELEALEEIIKRIPLWRELYERFGTQLPDDFWVDLAKITGCEAPEAKRLERTIKNAYLKDISRLAELKSHLEKIRHEEPSKKSEEIPTLPVSEEFPEELFERFITTDFAVFIRRDLSALEFFETAIKGWIEHLKKKLSKKRQTQTRIIDYQSRTEE